ICATMLNPDVDNDLRNKLVGNILSTALYASAMIVWPAVLFPGYRGLLFGSGGHGGISAATVLLALALLTVVLLTTGAFRFYAQRRSLRAIRKDVIESARKALKVPAGTFRETKIEEVVIEIAQDCARAYESHPFYGFYVAYLAIGRFA